MYRLIDSLGNEYLSEVLGTLEVNSKSKIYVRLDCPQAISKIQKYPRSY